MKQFPFRYYVLLADMRTGSNLFEDVISQFDDFVCLGELFNPKFVGGPKAPSMPDLTVEARDADPVAIIEQAIDKYPDQLMGFRHFSNHDPLITKHCLNDPTCAKIVLTRNPMDSFVSLQIAQQTSQWQLRNLHVRKDARVTFDIDTFQKYLEAQRVNRQSIKEAIQETGQTAFHIAYEDMARVETFNGVAKFLGSDQQLTDVQSKTKRQNPDGLREKLTNYDEMREQVRRLNIFESDIEAYVEPAKTRGSVAVHAGRTIPIMYLPIRQGPNDPTVQWMQSLEADGNQPQTKMSEAEVQNWLGAHSDRSVLTVLEHPVERAYRAFNRRIVFLPSDKSIWLRRILREQFGLDFPSWGDGVKPQAQHLEHHSYTSALHKENFLKFLGFLKGNLSGQTVTPVFSEWSHQYSQVESYQRFTVPNFIVRPQDKDTMFSTIQKLHGLKAKRPLLKVLEKELVPLNTIYCDKIEQATRDAYHQDYVKFGFHDWKPIS